MGAPLGTIYLIKRAPITSDYNHTIDFKSPNEQLAYWGSLQSITLLNYSYVRRERRYIQCDKTFEELDGVNYLIYQNVTNGKWFYCFVINREYVNDNMTRVYFDIDVLQTFMFDYEIKPSYIAQSHVDRWDADKKPIYSRTEEGLEYGSEYVTESAYKIKHATAPQKHGFYLVYCKEHPVSEGTAGEPTTVERTPIPYTIYLLPNLEGATLDGSEVSFVNLTNATSGESSNIQVCNMRGLQKYMANSDFGNYVQQIIYLPYLATPYSVNGGIFNFTGDNPLFQFGLTTLTTGTRSITLLKIKTIYTANWVATLAEMDIFEGISGEMPQPEQWAAIKQNPRKTERDRRFESKLLCYPYRYNVFTDWTGAPALIKNEYISGDKIRIKNAIGFGFNAPRRFWVDGYRKDPEGRESSISQVIPMEQPIISDAYYTYMLQNRNQISANITNAGINAAISVAGSAASGVMGAGANLLTGNIGGAVASGVNSAANIAQAGANFQAVIRSQNAKERDLQNLPDTFSNTNDCTFAIIDETKYLTFYRKKICCEFAEQLAQYWHMYGYVVKRVEVPNTRSRTRFNYVKTVGANIVGEVEQEYLQALRAIYDRGVTFWHYSATDFYPLDYTFENIEVKLL